MALDHVILTSKVSDKLTKAALSAIVTEAFINALPLSRFEVNLNADKFAAYTTQVIGALHGEKLLSQAMEANANNPAAMKYLSKMHDAIAPVVTRAAQRIATENADTTEPLTDIVDNSRFTPEEMKELAAKGKDLDSTTVADVIKEKVVATIKDEKNAYDANAQMKQDIIDTLAETVGEDAPAPESWMDMQLAKTDPRQPISLFSRTQDVCMEALLSTESTDDLEDTDDISLESLVDITLNQTLNCFDSSGIPLETAIESLTHACTTLNFSDEEQRARVCAASQKSLVMTIIIITILETLKTMRLFCPSTVCIRKFVDTPTNLQQGNINAGASVASRIMQQVDRAKLSLRDPMYNGPELSKAFDALANLRTAVDNVSESVMPNKPEIVKALDSVCTMIENRKVNSDATPGQEAAAFSHETALARESNVAAFDKIHRILNRNTATSKIRICCESSASKSAESQLVTAIALDSAGAELSRLEVGIKMVPALGNVIDELHSCAEYSACHESAGMYELYFTDKCYAVPLMNN